MTILPVTPRKSIKQVDESGRYTIKSVSDPRPTKFGEAIVLTLLNSKGEERILFVPYTTDPSEQSNLGRLVKAFSSDTAPWLKKRSTSKSAQTRDVPSNP